MERQPPIQLLLVVNDPVCTTSARQALSALPHVHVTSAARLDEAQAQLAGKSFDVVLLALGLPDSPGVDALATLRRQAPHGALIVLTDDEAVGQASLRHGARDYLVKGQLATELGRVLRYALECQRFEDSLRQSEERFRLLAEGVKECALLVLDVNGNITSWNPGAEQILGYRADEILGKNFACVFPPAEVAAGAPQRELDEAAARGKVEVEGWRVRKNGSRFWSIGRLTALRDASGKLRGFTGIASDLSERRRFETLFRCVFDYTQDAIITIDETGCIILFNRFAEKVFGYEAAEVVGRNVRMLMPDPYRTEHDSYLAHYLRTGEAKILGMGRDVQGVRKDGSVFPLHLEVSQFFLDDKRHFIGTVRDISEQQQARAELEQLAAIVESSQEAVVSVSLNGIIQTWNPAAEQLFGYTAAEAVGQPFTMLVLPERIRRLHERFARIARGENSEPIETVRITKNGRHIDIAARFSAIRDATGTICGISSFSRDISERKQLEAQLQQAQKLEAVGHLAGGVAHDFNNLLTVISGFSEIVLSKIPEDDPVRELIREIKKAGDKAAALTRQLLAFSRKSVLEPKVLDLNAVVAEIEKLLRRLIGEDVLLTTVLSPDLRPVRVDPGQIEQVILNLAVNSRDAMPTGGRLTIETANVRVDEAFAANHPGARPGRHVLLAVSDTGCGMTPEVQAHIFEPFFTTKQPGKGTGLGLATVYGIVKQSGGLIYVYSEPNHGTSFKIYLPAVDEPSSSAKSYPGFKANAQGNETILLVEDEDAVRSITRLALQQFGYTVLEARNGVEALQCNDQHHGPLHLLITDVVMPEMGGRELVQNLLKLRPGLKVLYLSGYTDDAVVRHGVLHADVAFLQKPFTLSALTNKVRQVLDATA